MPTLSRRRAFGGVHGYAFVGSRTVGGCWMGIGRDMTSRGCWWRSGVHFVAAGRIFDGWRAMHEDALGVQCAGMKANFVSNDMLAFAAGRTLHRVLHAMCAVKTSSHTNSPARFILSINHPKPAHRYTLRCKVRDARPGSGRDPNRSIAP
jgi:hypothetical protein